MSGKTLLFVYGDLQKKRWQTFYKLVFSGQRAAYRGDLRAYRNDLAAIFDPAAPTLIHGELLVCPNQAVLHKVTMMEKPQYKRIDLQPLALDGELVPVYTFEYAGGMDNFWKLPRTRRV